MAYRPDGWKEIALKFLYGDGQIRSNDDEDLFEAGADAMLDGLKKGVDRPYPNVSYPFRTVVAMQKGIVVFIPEEE